LVSGPINIKVGVPVFAARKIGPVSFSMTTARNCQQPTVNLLPVDGSLQRHNFGICLTEKLFEKKARRRLAGIAAFKIASMLRLAKNMIPLPTAMSVPLTN